MVDINSYTKNMDAVAGQEMERLWNMRDKLSGVSEATLPILIQYCTVYGTVQKLTANMYAGEYDKEWDNNLARLDKLNKMLLSFAKVLKLTDAEASESTNKFAKLLMK